MASIFKYKESRIPQIDGLRGFALLMVLAYHMINNPILFVYQPNVLQVVLRKFTYFTYGALDLFFVLSGYLIAKILIENKHSKSFFKVFYGRRLLRILPLFYLLLVIYLVLRSIGMNDPEGFLFGNELPMWSYFAYVPNYMMAFSNSYGAKILTPTWSLGVDEQFYLVAPAIIFLFKKKWIPYFVIPLIIAAPIFRASTDLYYMKILPFQMRMDSLFIGVLLAYLVCEMDLIALTKKKVMLLTGCIILVGLAILLLTYTRTIGVLDHSLFNLFYVLIVLYIISVENSFLVKVLKQKWLRLFGFISYGVYLFHQVISGLLHAIILDQKPRLNNLEDLGVMLIAFILSIGFGYLLHILIEKPLINFGHKFKYN